MQPISKVIWLSKEGNSSDEYEDAFYLSNLKNKGSPLRYAVSDGATEAAFSRLWATLLAKAYGSGLLQPAKFEEDLHFLQRIWKKRVDRHHHHRSLPWYAEEKLKMGSGATLTGLSIFHETDNKKCGKWEAVSIGDSCLFQIRCGVIVAAYPFMVSSKFRQHPLLISTNTNSNGRIEIQKDFCSGEWQIGDYFFLMTDAIANCFLSRYERTARPWQATNLMTRYLNSSQAIEYIKSLRLKGELRNDDVTIVEIKISEGRQ